MINGSIFSKPMSKEEEMELRALEASTSNSIRHQMKEEYTLRDKYFPYVESFLPKTEKLLFRHIAKYEDKWSEILTSPYPTKILPFGENDGGEDNDIIFKCVNINKNELKRDIKKLPLPGQLSKEKAAFQPLQIVMYLMIRYYIFTNQPQKAKILYPYYGYSIYWKRWAKSFKYGVNEQVMVYTINNMSYRNLIKKLGSVKKLLEYIVEHVFTYYHEGLAESCDEDIRYILDQVQSDIGSKVNSIATMYYNENENKNVIMSGSTLYDDEGTQRLDSSATATAETYAQRYTNKFFSDPLSVSRVKTACAMSKEVSAKEVEHTIDYIMSTATPKEIHELYSSIFYYYLASGDPKATEESIQSLRFIAVMAEVIKKGNSTNKNIVTIISYMNKWLEGGSNTFRLTNRDGTKTNYRKAVYNYFILSVTNK